MFISLPATELFEVLGQREASWLSHPDCPGHGVTFVLYQRRTESNVGSRVTRTVTGAARCSEPDSWIPAMSWTDEMEAEFSSAAAVIPRAPASYRFHRRFLKIFWITAVLLALSIGGLVYAFFGVPNAYQAAQTRIEEVATSPSPGDRLLLVLPDESGHSLWFEIRQVSDSSVTLQAYGTPSEMNYEMPKLDPQLFTGETLELERAPFSKLGVVEFRGRQTVVLNAEVGDGE